MEKTAQELQAEFDILNFNFGVKSPDDVVDFEFVYTGDSEIFGVQKGCGCTDAFVEGNKIKGQLNLATAQQYKDGLNDVSKSLSVYFDDGQPFYVQNDGKRLEFNRDKIRVALNVRGTVEKK